VHSLGSLYSVTGLAPWFIEGGSYLVLLFSVISYRLLKRLHKLIFDFQHQFLSFSWEQHIVAIVLPLPQTARTLVVHINR